MHFVVQLVRNWKKASLATKSEWHLLKVVIQAVAHIIVVKDATNARKREAIDDMLRRTIHENKATLTTVRIYRKMAAVTLGASLTWATRVGAVAFAMVLRIGLFRFDEPRLYTNAMHRRGFFTIENFQDVDATLLTPSFAAEFGGINPFPVLVWIFQH